MKNPRRFIYIDMNTFDYGLRYLSERRWCWRADDGSWRKTHKWAAELYLGIEYIYIKRWGFFIRGQIF